MPNSQPHVNFCIFERSAGSWLCRHCGYAMKTDRRPSRRCEVDRPAGVGRILTRLFAAVGITTRGGCQCQTIASELDARGPDCCAETFAATVAKIVDSAASVGIRVRAIGRIGIGKLLSLAIAIAKDGRSNPNEKERRKLARMRLVASAVGVL